MSSDYYEIKKTNLAFQFWVPSVCTAPVCVSRKQFGIRTIPAVFLFYQYKTTPPCRLPALFDHQTTIVCMCCGATAGHWLQSAQIRCNRGQLAVFNFCGGCYGGNAPLNWQEGNRQAAFQAVLTVGSDNHPHTHTHAD